MLVSSRKMQINIILVSLKQMSVPEFGKAIKKWFFLCPKELVLPLCLLTSSLPEVLLPPPRPFHQAPPRLCPPSFLTKVHSGNSPGATQQPLLRIQISSPWKPPHQGGKKCLLLLHTITQIMTRANGRTTTCWAYYCSGRDKSWKPGIIPQGWLNKDGYTTCCKNVSRLLGHCLH